MDKSHSEPQENADAPTRRPRAPTITIDTTAVSPPPAATQTSEGSSTRMVSQSPVSYADEGHSPSTAIEPAASSWTLHQQSFSGQRPDLGTEKSVESKDSRPTSPHNVSSPVTLRGNDRNQGFLAVPNTLRSRQNSVDSDDGSRSFASSQGETIAASTSFQGEKEKVAASSSSHASSENEKIMHDAHALTPDQGKEGDFHVEDNPFAFSPGMLNKMFNPKSLAAFYKLGGLTGLEKGLQTDRKAGLSIDEVDVKHRVTFEEATQSVHEPPEMGSPESSQNAQKSATIAHEASSRDAQGLREPYSTRKRVFQDNRLPEKQGKTLLQLMWITYNDKVLILLSVAAVVSLAIGLYQTFGRNHANGQPRVEWVEGVAIIVAILIVVIVGSLNDFQKERQFARLNKKKLDRQVKVIRSGKTIEMSVFDVLAGDVLHLEPGDMIPVDGVLIEGFNVKCDESQATGESDVIRKRPADEVYAAIEAHHDLKKMDPFIQSGARVMEGVGTYVVTSTGIHSSYGQTLMSLDDDPEITPLQSKLNVIAEYIAKLGGLAGLLLFVALFIKFLVQIPHSTLTADEKGQQFLNLFIIVVTIIVVAVPEGLPLAVTLALAFATTRMLRDNNLVRHLKACEVMGNATTICSDKTGTLTQNKMQIVAGTLGANHRFGVDGPLESDGDKDFAAREISAQELVSKLSPAVKELVRKSISLNSTAFEGEVDGQKTFIGSKTETALLIFAQEHLAMGPVSQERSNAKVLQLFPFDSGRKCMGIVVQLDNGKVRLFVKGASEIMLDKCTHVLREASSDISASPLAEQDRATLRQYIDEYASHSLRTIGIIYRDFDRWPPRVARRGDGDKDEIMVEDVCRHMVFIGLVGIKDPLRPGVLDAVRDCQKAGVTVRMVTGDNRLTAQAIAKDCGILQEEGDMVMEGPEFRNLSKHRQEEIIPRLRVLARSSPEDKRILVKRLKEQGETVAVTGDGTNDAPALKTADVGFSMGIAGTEVAKEASAIILMDDNFNSIVKALKWGRAVNDAVKRFLQFQLTVNVTAVVLTFVSAVVDDQEDSVLTAVQLLWVNLIMDTLAALALATDPPSDSILDRKPERKGSSILSTTMWKMILIQAIYQLAITHVLLLVPPSLLPGIPDDAGNTEGMGTSTTSQIQTLVFNTFVWMQIFNQWNNRRLDNRFNIFEGLSKNWFFSVISIIMCGCQILIITVGGAAFSISGKGQTGVMWAYALVLGALSIPVGAAIRLIPDRWLEKLVPEFIKKRATSPIPGVTVSDDEERYSSYPDALADIRNELAFLKRIKGGRLNNLRFAMKHPRETFLAMRSPSHSREHSRSNSMHRPPPQTPSREDSVGSQSGAPTPDSRRRSKSMRSRSNSVLGAATVMSGIVAGSIAAGWSPIERRGEPDFSQMPKPEALRQPSQSELQPSQPTPVLEEHSMTDEPQDLRRGRGPGPSNAQENKEPEVPMLRIPKPPRPTAPEAPKT